MCERTPARFRRLAPTVCVMNSRLLITLLCAGAVALACGSFVRSETSPAQAKAPVHKAAKTTADATPRVDGEFAVNIEPHAIRFALALTNEGKKHVELAFPSGQQYDFAVLDSTGREVYRWGAGRMFTQSVQNKLLDGGDTMHVAERVETTLPRGRYVAVATLRSSNFPITERSTFELR